MKASERKPIIDTQPEHIRGRLRQFGYEIEFLKPPITVDDLKIGRWTGMRIDEHSMKRESIEKVSRLLDGMGADVAVVLFKNRRKSIFRARATLTLAPYKIKDSNGSKEAKSSVLRAFP